MCDRLEVAVKNGENYDIVYEQSFSALKDELLRLELTGKKACIVTDSVVEPLYAQAVKEVALAAGNEVSVFVFKSGEENKNMEVSIMSNFEYNPDDPLAPVGSKR